MKEKMVNVNGVSICTESFGYPQNPAILLIMGATASMLYWDEGFCEKLANQGFFVIRYDNRDTGKSTTYPRGTAPYTIGDMAEDAIGVLNAWQIEKAHFVGMSLGGMITQIVAIKYPERVQSLTLFATGPWGPSDPDIPEMDQRIISFQQKAAQIDWENEDAVVNFLMEGSHLISGKKEFDKERAAALFRTEFKRANNYVSMYNHATLQGGEDYYGKINEINQPCLIIHGTEDLILNYRHAKFLERELKNSKLVTLNGTGHELHASDWDIIIEAISKEYLNYENYRES